MYMYINRRQNTYRGSTDVQDFNLSLCVSSSRALSSDKKAKIGQKPSPGACFHIGEWPTVAKTALTGKRRVQTCSRQD